jgi:hypothetical protein
LSHIRGRVLYIYLLKDEDEIVYVGKTECNPEEKLNRPSSHSIGRYAKHFDSFLIIEIPNHLDILTVETYFIFKYQPKYNKAGGSKELNVILKHHFQTDWSPYDWITGHNAVKWTDVKPFKD